MAPKKGFGGITNDYYKKCISRSKNVRSPATPCGLGEFSLRQYECKDYKSSYILMTPIYDRIFKRTLPMPFYMFSHRMPRPLLHLLLNNSVTINDFVDKVSGLDYELLCQTSELDADSYSSTFLNAISECLAPNNFNYRLVTLKLRRLNALLSKPDAYDKHYHLVMSLPISHSFEIPETEPVKLGLPRSYLKRLIGNRRNQKNAAEDSIEASMIQFVTKSPTFDYTDLDLTDPMSGSIELILMQLQGHKYYASIDQAFRQLMMLNSSLLFEHAYYCYDEYLNYTNGTAFNVSTIYDVTGMNDVF